MTYTMKTETETDSDLELELEESYRQGYKDGYEEGYCNALYEAKSDDEEEKARLLELALAEVLRVGGDRDWPESPSDLERKHGEAFLRGFPEGYEDGYCRGRTKRNEEDPGAPDEEDD